jgi:hypothetical protein
MKTEKDRDDTRNDKAEFGYVALICVFLCNSNDKKRVRLENSIDGDLRNRSTKLKYQTSVRVITCFIECRRFKMNRGRSNEFEMDVVPVKYEEVRRRRGFCASSQKTSAWKIKRRRRGLMTTELGIRKNGIINRDEERREE